MSNKIIILAEGYSTIDSVKDNVMQANCSCVLIKGKDKNIIIDTMTPWDSQFILDGNFENVFEQIKYYILVILFNPTVWFI